jgi:subtilisin family serine protease
MAAPHVSGAAAVYLERNPEATPADVRDWLIANATLDRLDEIGAGSPNRLLFLPGEFPVLPIVIDILPGSTVNPINRGSQGSIPVAVLTTDDFDPATLVLAGVRLGDEVGDDTPIRRRPNGTFMAGWEDVNGDGRPDLACTSACRSWSPTVTCTPVRHYWC